MPQPLVMTPLLQQAIRLLTLPLPEVRVMLEAEAARLGLRRLADDEVDPLDEEELALAAEENRPPRTFSRSVLGAPDADVWLLDERLVANGSVPRFVVPSGEPDKGATWFMKAVRQRANTFQRVAAALVEANQPWLSMTAQTPTRVSKRALVQSLGMHSSTLDRIAHTGMMETARGLTRFESFLRT